MGYNVTDDPAFHASSISPGFFPALAYLGSVSTREVHSQQQRGTGRGNFPLGSWEAFLLGGPGHFHHSPPGQPLFLCLCDSRCCNAGEREGLNIPSKPLLPEKLQHFAHVSWQDMASTAKEDTGQSSSAASDGSLSQPPQAGLPEAADDSQCPICLGPMKRPAYVTYCMHKFCLRCIWQWARARDNCPVCRQPMEQLLHSVRGDSDYKERAIGPSARLQRRVATERGLQPVTAVMLRMMQAVHDHQRLAGRSRPTDTESAQTQEAAPGPSNAHSQQGPAASHEMTPLREGEHLAGPAAPLEPQNGTE